MFCFDKSLEYLDIHNFDTSNVNNMKFMFEFYKLLKDLSIDTSNVKDINVMFQSCATLISLNLSNSKMSKDYDREYIFNSYISLKSLYLSSFYA